MGELFDNRKNFNKNAKNNDKKSKANNREKKRHEARKKRLSSGDFTRFPQGGCNQLLSDALFGHSCVGGGLGGNELQNRMLPNLAKRQKQQSMLCSINSNNTSLFSNDDPYKSAPSDPNKNDIYSSIMEQISSELESKFFSNNLFNSRDAIVSNGVITVELTNREICEAMEKAFCLRNVNPKKWDETLVNYEPKYDKLYESIANIFINDDKSKLINYLQYRNAFADFTIEDIYEHKGDNVGEAFDLICQEEVRSILISDKPYYELSTYKQFQDYIINVSDKILNTIHDELGYDIKPSLILEMVVCCMELMDKYNNVSFLDESRRNIFNEGKIGNVIGLNEWTDFNRAVVFRVFSELLRPNIKDKFNEFKKLATQFQKDNYKLYRLPTKYEGALISQLICDFDKLKIDIREFVSTQERLMDLNRSLEKLKNNHWILDNPYPTSKNSSLDIQGQVNLTIISSEHDEFAVFYDGRFDKHVVLIGDKGSKCRVLSLNVLDLNYDIIEYNDMCGFSLNATHDVFVTQLDRDIKKQGAIYNELSSLGLRLASAGKNLLSVFDKNYPGIFDDIKDLPRLHIILNEDDKKLSLIATKRFFERKLDILYYDKYGNPNEELISGLKNIHELEDNAEIAITMDMQELCGKKDIKNENDASNDDETSLDANIEETLYKDKIYEYIRKSLGEAKKRLSIDWINEFFKPLGGVTLYSGEGKGDHSKLKLGDTQNFWTVSPVMIENGVYINNIPIIIKAFRLSNKEVYEKCVMPFCENQE